MLDRGPTIPFTYRRSGLDGRIVLETDVRLRPEAQAQLDEQIAEMFEWRQRGTPFNQPCCGSVFKNPSGPSWKREGGPAHRGAADRGRGAQGRAVGGAEVSPMHANYFVNTGGATAADVRALIERAQQEVEARFGVRLEPEVKLIGRRGEYLNRRVGSNASRPCPTTSPTNPATSTTAPSSATAPRSGISATSCPAP